MLGDLDSFYVTADNKSVVLEVTTDENEKRSILVHKDALRQMLDAEPVYDAPVVRQDPTPRTKTT